MEQVKTVAERIRSLRESVNLSQVKMAELIGTTQSCMNRYETSVSSPPLTVLLWYADYFDVSMDYIFGRTDKPQGTTYDYHPKIEKNSEELSKFVEMCFDPNSRMNDRLKKTLLQMLKEGDGK